LLETRQRLLSQEHPATLTAINNLAQTLAAQGDLGARELQEQALEASRRLLGNEHSLTSIAAWNLIQTAQGAGDTGAVGNLVLDHLAWLLERDPATLSGDQRKIRQRLLEAMSASE
jgi:hypothetical protein